MSPASSAASRSARVLVTSSSLHREVDDVARQREAVLAQDADARVLGMWIWPSVAVSSPARMRERALAGAVGTDQAVASTIVQQQADVLEEDARAVRFLETRYAYGDHTLNKKWRLALLKM